MKHCKLLLAAIISLLVPFFTLKETKASTNVTLYSASLFDYGAYNVYYATNNNGYVITDMFDFIQVPMQWESCTVTEVAFDNYYNGLITMKFQGNISTNLWECYLEGDGAYITNLSSTDVTVNLVNCQKFYIYGFCGNDNDINLRPKTSEPFVYPHGSLEVSPSVPEFYNSFNEYQLIDHYFPSWNLTAYLWGKSYGEYSKMYTLDLPFVSIPRSTSATYEINHRIPILRNQKIVVYFLSDQFISNANTFVSTASGVSVDKLLVQYNFPRLQIGSSNQVFYLNELSVDLGDQSATQFSVGFNVANVHIYPIFIGNYDNIPDSVALMKSGEYRNTYTKLLQQIIDSLAGNPNITPVDPDVYSDTSTAISDTNTIETSIQGDFNNAMNNINLNDYGIGSTLYQSMVFLTDNLQQIFNKSGEFKILFTLPLVLGIALFFIGRGSVVFRQGNIDRAELHRELKNYEANEFADQVMGYENDSRATNVAMHRVSNSRLIKRK